MKKSFFVLAFFLACLSSTVVYSQVNVQVNIGQQPLWGPTGYDYVEYYYLPEYEVYYDVPAQRFVYLDGSNWAFVSALPSRFGRVNLYNSYKVVVNQPKAYRYFSDHKKKYKGYKAKRGQIVIRDSNEPKYYVVKGHPHGMPPGQAKKAYGKSNGNGKGKGHSKGHGNKGKHKG